jgi:hypothetical protein
MSVMIQTTIGVTLWNSDQMAASLFSMQVYEYEPMMAHDDKTINANSVYPNVPGVSS